VCFKHQAQNNGWHTTYLCRCTSIKILPILLPKADDRVLQISFEYDTARTIRCVVDDNGIGREASAGREQTFRKKSLALSFVNQRLELIQKTYLIEGSITLIDKKDEHYNSLGTTVVIVLPILNS